MALLIWEVQHHKDKHYHKVNHQAPYCASKAPYITSPDALAEKYAMVVISVDAHVTIIAVLHVFLDVHVAFYTVQNSDFVTFRILTNFVLGLIIFCLLGFLQMDLSLLTLLKVLTWRLR